MRYEHWREAPRKLALMFIAVTLVPAIALIWLTTELVERDRSLEKQHANERLERTAANIVAAVHQRVSHLENHLHRLANLETNRRPDNAALVVVEGDRVTATPPGALAYYPTAPRSTQLPRGLFAEGERYEYRDRNWLKAIARFQSLARSGDPAIRGGALLRIGRNQLKAGQVDATLATFDELATLGVTVVEGYPAALIALEARCRLLEKVGRHAELRSTAKALRSALVSGTWPLLRDAYDFYIEEARRWSGDSSETERERSSRALAAAFASTHEKWLSDGNAPHRQWLVVDGRPLLLVSTGAELRLVTLIAGADFLSTAWHDLPAVKVSLTDGAGRPVLGHFPEHPAAQATVPPDASGLPWTLRVTTTSEIEATGTVRPRYVQFFGLAAVLCLIAGSAYFTLRGVTRELAVARLQSDFVSAVSHEFRTPLASVRHLSDILAQGRVSDHHQRQHCYELLSRESGRLEKLVEELLDFGRIDAGQYHYRFERVDAANLLRGLVGQFQDKVKPSGYCIELSVAVEPAWVLADREALSRAIWNLLDNAVKYSPNSRTIWVALGREDNSAVINVRDRGLGIAMAEQNQIFQKFVRGSNAQSEQIQGTGIGLAMVQQIVEAHNGEVHVESRPDHGSTFAVRLPLETPA